MEPAISVTTPAGRAYADRLIRGFEVAAETFPGMRALYTRWRAVNGEPPRLTGQLPELWDEFKAKCVVSAGKRSVQSSGAWADFDTEYWMAAPLGAKFDWLTAGGAVRKLCEDAALLVAPRRSLMVDLWLREVVHRAAETIEVWAADQQGGYWREVFEMPPESEQSPVAFTFRDICRQSVYALTAMVAFPTGGAESEPARPTNQHVLVQGVAPPINQTRRAVPLEYAAEHWFGGLERRALQERIRLGTVKAQQATSRAWYFDKDQVKRHGGEAALADSEAPSQPRRRKRCTKAHDQTRSRTNRQQGA